MTIHALPDIIKDGYEIHEWQQASSLHAGLRGLFSMLLITEVIDVDR